MDELDDREICIAGKVRVGDEWIPVNVLLKFKKGTFSEEFYEAIKGRDYTHGLNFINARIHDGCEGDKDGTGK